MEHIQVVRIDKNGFFLTDEIVTKEKFEQDKYLLLGPVPEGFYHPKWNGVTWEEGLTQKEIAERIEAQPAMPISIEERMNEMQAGFDQAVVELTTLIATQQQGG
ncbi:hypothetical protein AM501_27275 [Aneurinibacillus migulanus]|uniref:hypothetical protein n=1 Tax=Aneurinibacillus migulanus TaxID=47500 RepID=UPI0005B9CEF5|nr:hypothetical protein [Aneurinibacillus migulanus]KIV56951.1 hypothetical protein TS64_07900 [Aneurinibacillus migulanus]KPD05268.1 hypothetical protein AM501_27275 [Aneurinibacillus migulanus]